jgi:uncharacterized protein (DUF2147 family)
MKKIKNFAFLLLIMFFAQSIFAHSIFGVCKTIDDETGDPKSYVKIYKKDGKAFGRVVKLLPAATTDVCIDCPGDKKGKSLYDVDIIWDMEQDGDVWDDGNIVDPANGKVYSCKISLDGNDKLDVRGYFGFSLFGRTQTWFRVKE